MDDGFGAVQNLNAQALFLLKITRKVLETSQQKAIPEKLVNHYLLLVNQYFFALVLNQVIVATTIVLHEHLDLHCIVEDFLTHLIMNVSSHHNVELKGYMLQMKLKNNIDII